MSESIFASIIDEMAERDLARYSDIPPFKTSKKHDRAMQRIFKRYEKNTRKLRPQAEIRIRTVRKRIIVALVVIILAVFTGFTAAYFISRSFRGEVYSDNTRLFPINMEDCPAVIEDEYYLSEVPDEFEKANTTSTPFRISKIYENRENGKIITFEQWTKPEFDPLHFNTEKGELFEVEINGYYGVFLDLSNDNHIFTQVIWDNGDYILHIVGSLPKNAMLDLAKSAKISERTNN